MDILSIIVPIITAAIAAVSSIVVVMIQTKKTREEQKSAFEKQSEMLKHISEEDLAILKETQMDMIRNEIKKIYFRRQSMKSLNQYDRESLDSLYRGYEILGGNSFVHDIYEEMRTWEIIRPTK